MASDQRGSELTKLAGEDMEHDKLTVLGFHLSLRDGEGGDEAAVLELNTWVDGVISKTVFIKQG